MNWRIQIGHALQLVSAALLALSVGWWSLLGVVAFVAANLYAAGARVKVVA